MSSEWVSADEALRMGLVWRVCEPDELLPELVGTPKSLPPGLFRA